MSDEREQSNVEAVAGINYSYRPRKQRITKQQSNAFKEWLQGLPEDQQHLSAAKIAKKYFDEQHVEVSRMFACNVKKALSETHE